MRLNCGVEDSWEFLGLQGDPTSPSYRKSVLNIHWKDWCWNWNSSTLAARCEELTHLKRPWCWERLKAGGEGDDRGLDGWMASRLDGHEFGWTSGVGDGQEAWRAAVHGVAKSRTWLSDWTERSDQHLDELDAGRSPSCLCRTSSKSLPPPPPPFSRGDHHVTVRTAVLSTLIVLIWTILIGLC